MSVAWLGTWEGYTGWVYRVGNTGSPSNEVPDCSRRVPVTAKRAPDVPCRGTGVGGHWEPDVLGPEPGAPAHPPTHPAGPVGALWAPPW